jgi:signal peptide peptidase SppA
MSYPRIAAKVARECWSLEPSTFRAILDTLNTHQPGQQIEAMDGQACEIVSDYEAQGIAVIPVHGIIGHRLSELEMMCGGCSIDLVGQLVDMAAEDENIHSIILDISSPGGTITGLPELSAKISAVDKPIVAFTDSNCASAALWIAHSADALYASESSHVGSVGAYIMLLDSRRWYDDNGHVPTPIVRGDFKLAGADFKELTGEERAMFQASVDKTVAKFKAVVLARHDIEEQHLEGQVFDGDDAERFGFVDAIFPDLDQVASFLNESRAL